MSALTLRIAVLLSLLVVGCSAPAPGLQGNVNPVATVDSGAVEVDAGTDAGSTIDAGLACPPRHHEENGVCVQKLKWVDQPGLPIDEARDHHMSFSFETDAGTFMGLAGGMNSHSTFDSVFVARVTDGVLGAWAMSVDLMPEALAGGAVAVIGGRVYMMGGIDGTMGLTLNSYSAPLNGDGTVGPWRAERALAGAPRYHHSAVVLGDSILVTGGFDSQSIFAGAFLSKVAADGSLGEWSSVETAGAMSHHANVVVGSRVFTIGGFDGQGRQLLKVFAADRSADGGLTPWVDVGANLPSRHRTHSVSVFNGALYLLQGEDGTASFLGNAWAGTIHAPLLSDGGIGPWVDDMIVNPNPRRHTHQSPAIGPAIFSCFGTNQAKEHLSSCSALTLY